MTNKKRGTKRSLIVGIDLAVGVMWLDYVLALPTKYYSLIDLRYHIITAWCWWLVVGRKGCMFWKWGDKFSSSTDICYANGQMERIHVYARLQAYRNPNPSSAAFSLEICNLAFHQIIFFTGYSDVNQLSSHLQYRRPSWCRQNSYLTLFHLLHWYTHGQNHCDKFRWCASSQRKDMIE